MTKFKLAFLAMLSACSFGALAQTSSGEDFQLLSPSNAAGLKIASYSAPFSMASGPNMWANNDWGQRLLAKAFNLDKMGITSSNVYVAFSTSTRSDSDGSTQNRELQYLYAADRKSVCVLDLRFQNQLVRSGGTTSMKSIANVVLVECHSIFYPPAN